MPISLPAMCRPKNGAGGRCVCAYVCVSRGGSDISSKVVAAGVVAG